MTGMKPLIGVALDLYKDVDCTGSRGVPGQMMTGTTKPSIDAVRDAGGLSIGLGEALDENYALELCRKLDGLIVPGGPDIFPGTYGRQLTPYNSMLCVEKDRSDVLYLRAMLKLGKPIFGICRGMQLVNVLLGGTLLEDIPAYGKTTVQHFSPVVPDWLATHLVECEGESKIRGWMPEPSFMVNSFHHQCVVQPGEGMRITARCSDGIVEAIERSSPFILGTQWHPEYQYSHDPDQLLIFRGFVEQCA
jgi:putative glutamine amidotransferase